MTKINPKKTAYKILVKLCEYAIVCFIFLCAMWFLLVFLSPKQDIKTTNNIIARTTDDSLILIFETTNSVLELGYIYIRDKSEKALKLYECKTVKTIPTRGMLAIEFTNFPYGKDYYIIEMNIGNRRPIWVHIRENSKGLFEIEKVFL